MHSPFHAVARGLRVTHVGYLLACWGAAAAFGMHWLNDRIISNYYWHSDEIRWVFIGLFFATLATVVAGLIVGFVGRVRCLKVPEEYTVVRGRALAAVVLEVSGWLSLLVGIGVMAAMGFRWLPSLPWIPGIGMILSGVMVLCGRILFLRFLWALARAVEDGPSGDRARSSLALFLIDWGVGLLGVGVAAGGSALGMYELTSPLAYLVWIAAGASGLYGLILYDRLLGGLARSVQAFADTPPEEEEAAPVDDFHHQT
jgi:hypothetical protein